MDLLTSFWILQIQKLRPQRDVTPLRSHSKSVMEEDSAWKLGLPLLCVSNFRSPLREPPSQLFAEIGILWVSDKKYSVYAGTASAALEQHPISKHIDISAAKHMNIHTKWGKQRLETVSVQIKACRYMVPNLRRKLEFLSLLDLRISKKGHGRL